MMTSFSTSYLLRRLTFGMERIYLSRTRRQHTGVCTANHHLWLDCIYVSWFNCLDIYNVGSYMGPPTQINQAKLSCDASLHCGEPVPLTAYALLVSWCMYLSHQTNEPSRKGPGDGLQARRDPLIKRVLELIFASRIPERPWVLWRLCRR